MRIPTFLVLALAALLALSACTSSPGGTPEKFTLAGQSVEFAPPATPWTRDVQELPAATAPSPGTGSGSGGTVIRFKPSWPDSHLTVSALANWSMKSWAEDPEKTKAHVEHLQTQIVKREEGQITRQSQVKLGGEDALRLEFQYKEGVRMMKGLQVHAIHQGAYWTVALLCPEENFKEGAAAFEALVDSFKFQ